MLRHSRFTKQLFPYPMSADKMCAEPQNQVLQKKQQQSLLFKDTEKESSSGASFSKAATAALGRVWETPLTSQRLSKVTDNLGRRLLQPFCRWHFRFKKPLNQHKTPCLCERALTGIEGPHALDPAPKVCSYLLH